MTRSSKSKPVVSLDRLIVWIFLGVAFVLFAVALFSGLHVADIMAREERASGVVTALKTKPGADGDVFSYPVVTFRVPDGARHTIEIAQGASPPAYTVDQAVTVAFEPAHPEDARIVSQFDLPDLWILPAITGFLSVAFLLAASLAWWLSRQFP